MAFLGTGFLYNWGAGISGQQFVPKNLTGRLFSGLSIGENFNATSNTPVIAQAPAPVTKKANFGRFNFGIYNLSSQISPINSFSINSSISGSGSNTELDINQYNKKVLIFTSPKDFNIISNRGVIISGSGNITGINLTGNAIFDTFISTKRNDRNYLSNDSWIENSGEFLKNDFIGFSSGFGGVILKDVNTTFGSKLTGVNSKYFILNRPLYSYEIDYGINNFIESGKLGKISLYFQNLKNEYPIGSKLDSNNKMWASYSLTQTPKLSGLSNKLSNSNFSVTVPGTINRTQNVFSYAFQFVDLVTLRDSGTLVISGNQEDPFAELRLLKNPELFTGFDTSFSNYIGYCFTRKDCESKELEPPEDVYLCWTGSGSEPPPRSREEATGRAYLRFVSGVIEQFRNQGANRKIFDGISDITLSSGILVSGLFAIQTGSIIYNSFFSGDSLSFNLYPFDYTGLYKLYHLNNNPLYPTTGFTITYPTDFTGIDSLVNVLNNRLKDISYPVWYPYDCLSGESTGIYITGGLMEFEKNVLLPTGNPNYNNIINFRSLRNYPSGFNISLNLVDREEYIYNLELQYFRKGFSYLIPDTIELQAKTGNQWMVLDRRVNLYNQLTGLEKTLIPLNAKPEIFINESESEDFLNSSQITGTGTFDAFSFEEILLSGGFLTLREFNQKGVLPSNGPEYCLVPDLPFDRNIYIVTPTGFPTGVDGCDPKVQEQCNEPCSDIIPFCDASAGCIQKTTRDDCGCLSYECECPPSGQEPTLELFLSVLRTGWNLELTGIYLNCLTGPDFNPEKISFPEYRFVAKDFSGLRPSIENQFLIPKNEAYFTNINLFSLQSSGIGIHEGQSQCLIGSDYILDIADTVAIPFSKIFEYTISGEDRSGVYKAFNQPLIYTPTEAERDIKFIRRSGKIVGNATGLVNGDFTGINTIIHTFSAVSPSGYWYNPAKKEVYFSEITSGFFTGSGIFETGVFAIKEQIINFELLAGGRLDIIPQYIEVSGSGLFTGLLLNQRYFQTGARGIYNLTGSISGFSTSGFFDVLIPTGTRYTGNGVIEPFVSGRIFSGSGLAQSGYESIVKEFPSENFISGNLSTLNSLISGDFITSNNYIFRSPDEFSVFIINTGFITGTPLNVVLPFPDDFSVTGDGSYKDPNGFIFRNKLNVLMTGNFLVSRSDKSCFDFWPNITYPLYTIATITGYTSNTFISGITGLNGISGNLVIDKGSFGLISGFLSTGFVTGSLTNFTKTDYGTEIDIIDSEIRLTRSTQYPLYNPLYQTDSYDNNWSNGSGEFYLNPAYTLWNRDGWTGLNNFKIRQYTGLYSLWGGGGIGNNIVGEELIMWNFLNNKYYLIKFNQWTQGANGGGFSYIRSPISGNLKEVYYELPFVKNENILIKNQNNFSSGEERIKGLYKIQNILSGNSNFIGNKYLFSCLRDNDIIFNSPSDKNIYLSSTGNLIGRPVLANTELMNSTENKPFFPISTGFRQASIDILFNFNSIRIFDRISINNTTITYHPDPAFFFAPDYFNDINSLLSTINTNSSIFNVTGTKINNSGINLVALDIFAPGDVGNNIQVSTSSRSGINIPFNFLTGGQTFYPIMSPTSLFSGFATGKAGVTGIFSETGSGIITGVIPTFTGVRTFTGIWGLKSGINNNFKSYIQNNLLSGDKYISYQNFDTEFNIVQLMLLYTNELNVTENISDVAQLKIKDLNYNKIFPTGDPNISDQIIFRITGVGNL